MNISGWRVAALCLGASWMSLPSLPAQAQSWPSRPVKIIVPFPPGQAADIIARLVAERLSSSLGQPVLIDNRPGAGAALGTELGAKATPDGYTLLAGGSAALAINPHLYPKLGYDSLRDFEPITQLVSIAMVFAVEANSPLHSLKDLIEMARKKPGEFRYGSSGSGSTSHLVSAAFASQAGISLLHVPYKGAVPALTDLLAGQLNLVADTPPTLLPHIQSKRLRAIAVSTAQRVPQLPAVATVAEQGLTGFDLSTWTSFVAPSRTPVDILERLNAESVKIIAHPDVQRRLIEMGFIPVGSSRLDFSRFLAAEHAKWRAIVKASDAKVE